MRRAGTLGLAIVLTLALLAGPAEAKPKKVKVETQVTIDYDSGDFFGEVTAAKPKCERDRAVQVAYLGPPNEEPGEPIASEGTTASEDDGSWSLTVGPAEGHYDAAARKQKIKKRRGGKVRKIIVCREGVSQPKLVL